MATPKGRSTRSVSAASSGGQTVRPRSNSHISDSSDHHHETVADPSDTLYHGTPHLPSWPSDPNIAQPPPQWRQLSNQGYNSDDEDPEDGPSDYWRQPSPPLSPDRTLPASSSPWLPSYTGQSATPDSRVEADADAVEYSKRIEQVLSMATGTPLPSPTPSQGHTGTGLESEEDGWGEYQNGSGVDYDQAVRDLLHDGEAVPDDELDELHEDELGGPYGSHLHDDNISDHTPSTSSFTFSFSGVEKLSGVKASPNGPSRTYLHPSVSRLRSQPTHLSRLSSLPFHSAAVGHARIPSHFSQVSLSRSDSLSAASAAGPSRHLVTTPHGEAADEMRNQGPAFVFHPLRHLSSHLFNRGKSGSASPGRGVPYPAQVINGSASPVPNSESADHAYGKPTVIDVHGMIAVGTESGYVVVYGFGQEIRFVLGNETTAASGPVTAVTICPDQTFVGVGHASGNIYLYDVGNPSKPARTTLALTLRQAQSGQKEGHLQGSRILHIGFVGKRHTSIVTADEAGRAFWFSLGRVMGVDSNDVVRMLGSYPERERPEDPDSSAPPSTAGSHLGSHPAKRPTTLFSTLPLPLGVAPHSTDEFHFTALLTPVKLVIVGMKPTAKTWFRKMREAAGGPYGGYTGCAAWLKSGEVTIGNVSDATPSDPVLAYAWGTSLRFLRVRIQIQKDQNPKVKTIKKPEFIEGRRWEAPHPIQYLDWYDSEHIILITAHEIILLNVRTMAAVENTPLQTKLLTTHDFYSGLSVRKSDLEAVPRTFASSARTHRGKLFLLTKANVQVGTLQHWNDRVLANVHRGDFLGAINLALAYYEGRAPGNTINLPEDPEDRREVVGARVCELMRASLDWAFSEERMKDDTHYSADGRGVDLSALFEGLASACIDACLAMGNMTFLFDEAYEYFANAGIQGIFLTRLEGYIFEERIEEVPPNVAQALIAMHDDRGEYTMAEAVIWHIAPECLDINQAVNICIKHGLWDALIYVYTRALNDYTAPIVKLAGVVCDILHNRNNRPSLVGDESDEFQDEERLAPDAYKLYAYIANVLSGLWYPSDETMPEPEATRARNDAYGMLFSDSNMEWPAGSGDVVWTSTERSDVSELPYPYLRLLLHFDTEAFLHAMDIAFEDSYLNDSSRPINRQTIVNLMLDVMDSGDFHSSDVTFLHIFVARNLPKYPQFIFIPPSTSHRILVSLAADPDLSTREDRQLAAEYLLSAYTPHDTDEMLAKFEEAGFFRILRAAYSRDRKWPALIETLLKDPETDTGVFSSLNGIITSSRTLGGTTPAEVTRAISDALPQLFDLSVRQTARFLERSLPSLHETAIADLDASEHKQTVYLRCLLDPSADEDTERGEHETASPAMLSLDSRHKYVDLLSRHDPNSIVPFLDERGPEFFDLERLAEQFEQSGTPEGQLWALDRAGKREETFDAVASVLAAQGADLADGLHKTDEGEVHIALGTIAGVAHMAVRICREHSGDTEAIEDMWYSVLHAITDLVHQVSTLGSVSQEEPKLLTTEALDTLRSLVQDTLQALLSTSSPRLSFARLFKRLVGAAPSTRKGKAPAQQGHAHTPSEAAAVASGARAYSEFRAILTGMLDTFRADAEVLGLSIRLVEADVFDLLAEKIARSQAGWRPGDSVCSICHRLLWPRGADEAYGRVAVRADGSAVHFRCEEAEAVMPTAPAGKSAIEVGTTVAVAS